jgi:uncharacterized membrane protein
MSRPALSRGRIYQIVCHLEAEHTSFAVSRLIMMSGVSVRKFASDSEDSLASLSKIQAALRSLLKADELARIQHLFEAEKGESR